MKMRLLCYRDSKLGVFGTPFSERDCSNEDLIETVRRMAANPEIPSHYFEYELYSLGSYDDKNGSITPIIPEFIVSFGEFKSYRTEKKEEVKDSVSS